MKKTIAILVGLLVCFTTFAHARDYHSRDRRHKNRSTHINIGHRGVSIGFNRSYIRGTIRIPTRHNHYQRHNYYQRSRGEWVWVTERVFLCYETISEKRWVKEQRTEEKQWNNQLQVWVIYATITPAHWEKYKTQVPVYKTIRKKVWVTNTYKRSHQSHSHQPRYNCKTCKYGPHGNHR